MSNSVIIRYNGLSVECYGTLRLDSNIQVVCEDEGDEGIVTESFKSWTEVVKTLVDNKAFESDLIELQAI